MSIQIEIKVNADKVAKAFRQAPKKLGKNLQIAIVKSATVVVGASKPATPIDTGLLRRSINADIKPLSAIIAPHTNYAVFVHEGTRFMNARPFMEKGAKASQSRIDGLFTQAVDNTLKSIGKAS